jgi:hypothetical protein
MLARSFRLVTAGLIPRAFRCKQAVLLAVAILAGCGGSGAPKAQIAWHTIRNTSFRFEVPAGWSASGPPRSVKVSSGKDLIRVATFPLARVYRPALFTRVESELASRMAAVAKQTGGLVTAHHVATVDGIKSHSYDVKSGDRTDTYTFVLRGKREYLLLCSADPNVCGHLLTSFAAR